VVALLPIVTVDMWMLGLASMATDGCAPDQPCRPGLQIDRTYSVATVATLVFLAGLGLAVAVPGRRLAGLRWLLVAAALLCAVSPALWLLGGNPRP
jgi:hypothetical protein